MIEINYQERIKSIQTIIQVKYKENLIYIKFHFKDWNNFHLMPDTKKSFEKSFSYYSIHSFCRKGNLILNFVQKYLKINDKYLSWKMTKFLNKGENWKFEVIGYFRMLYEEMITRVILFSFKIFITHFLIYYIYFFIFYPILAFSRH